MKAATSDRSPPRVRPTLRFEDALIASRPLATPALLDIFLGFLQVSFSAVGGAAAPLRYVLVVRKQWLSEDEFAETFGMCQALPGAVGANLAVIVGDRFAGWRGAFAAVFAFSVPAMCFAVLLAMAAIALAEANPRVAHAEVAIAAATAGLSIGNGARLAWHLWNGSDGANEPLYRIARMGIAGGGILLVLALHLWLGYVVALSMGAGLALERVRAALRRAVPPE